MNESEPYYLKPLIRGVLAMLIAIMMWTWIYNLPVFLRGGGDFCQLSTAGFMVRTGHARELYDATAQEYFRSIYVGNDAAAIPSNHPAYEALLYAPFTVFSYRAAYFVFAMANIALLIVTYRIIRPRMGAISKIYRWLPAVLFAGSLPIGVALLQGQDSILLLATLASASVALDAEYESLAGALVALGLFKFTIALPIGLLFFAWRRWRFTTGFALVGLSEVALSIKLVGINQSLEYIHSLRQMIAALSPAGQALYGIQISTMGNLRGLIFGVLSPMHFSSAAIQAATIISSGVVLLWVAFAGWRARPSEALMLAIVAATVVSYHFLTHDMSVLFLPIVVALNRYMEASQWDPGMVGRSAAVVFIAPAFRSFFPAQYFFLVCVPLCVFLFFLSRNGMRSDSRTPFGLPLSASRN